MLLERIMTGMALLWLLTLAVLFAGLPRDTLIGKSFRRLLVEEPARLLNGGPLRTFVAIVVLFGLVAFAVAAPEMVAVMGMTDLSLYLDLVVLAFALRTLGRFKSATANVAASFRRACRQLYLGRVRFNRRSGRTRPLRKPRRPPPSDDNFRPGAWAIT